jgi:polar amino acid transport system permease protein
MPVLETGTTDLKRLALAELSTRPRPAIGRYVAATVAIMIAVLFIWSLAVNEAVDWTDVGRYLFNPRVLDGVVMTLQITVLSLLIGFSSGLVIALMRLSQSRILQTIAIVWVWFFRAVPVLVLLILVNNIALLYRVDTKTVISPFLAAIVAFGANEGAYASEIFRSSIKSVHQGQFEAAKALGMGSVRMYWRIVLPQAMRISVPPLANNTINMLKGTSLVSYIGVSDLLYTTQSIYAQNYKVIPLLLVACLWYLAMVSVLSIAQSLIERRLGFDRKRRVTRAAEEIF